MAFKWVTIMQCQMCGKAGMTGNNVSHSNRKTKTRWKANVHKQTLAINGKPTRVKICSRCLRTMYKPPRGPKARARAAATG